VRGGGKPERKKSSASNLGISVPGHVSRGKNYPKERRERELACTKRRCRRSCQEKGNIDPDQREKKSFRLRSP